MKILLVIPKYNLTTEVNYQYVFPLGLGYISSAMKNRGHDVDCLNLNHHIGTVKEIVSNHLDNFSYDIVASGHTGIGYAVIEKIVQASREHHSKPKVILGGALINSEPELMLNALKPDFEVIGEGEITIVELLDAIENNKDFTQVNGIGYLRDGEPFFTPKREPIKDLDTLPLPDFEGMGFNEYLNNLASDVLYGELDYPRTYPLLASRGCPFSCSFCLSEDTLILMADGTSCKLKDIKIGDKIMGVKQETKLGRLKYCISEVKDKWKTKKNAVKIELLNGNILICSEDHRFLTAYRGWKHTIGKMGGKGQRPYLTKNSLLRGPLQIYETPESTDDYKRGYLGGIIEGDGTFRYFRADNGTGKEHDRESIERSKEYLKHFGIRVNKNNSLKVFPIMKNLMAHKENTEFFRGYLAGIFDAGGGLSNSILRITNKDKEVISFICKALKHLKFKHVVERPSRKIYSVRIKGGLPRLLHFSQIISPAISRKRIDLIGYQIRNHIGIKSITNLNEERELYDITTSTENFIANGIISHNCYHTLGRGYRERSLDNVMEELKINIPRYKINSIDIYDDLLSLKRDRLLDFAKRLKELTESLDWDCKWTCQLSVINIDKELVQILKDCGCQIVSFGFESYNQKVLNSMRKPISPEKIDNAIKVCREVGMGIQGNFIFGDTAETVETATETLNYWKENGKGQILIGFIQPYPGSEIYHRCVQKGIIGDKLDFIRNKINHTNWFNMTENMTDEEILWLKKEIVDARRKYAYYLIPEKKEKTGERRYDLHKICPFCDKQQIYKNCSINNKYYYVKTRQCRDCRMRFFLVSRLYKFTMDYYNELDFFRRTYLSIRDKLLKRIT